MAKMKKYPKQPKMKASVEVWKRYEERCKEVDRYNNELKRKEAEKKTHHRQSQENEVKTR